MNNIYCSYKECNDMTCDCISCEKIFIINCECNKRVNKNIAYKHYNNLKHIHWLENVLQLIKINREMKF